MRYVEFTQVVSSFDQKSTGVPASASKYFREALDKQADGSFQEMNLFLSL